MEPRCEGHWQVEYRGRRSPVDFVHEPSGKTNLLVGGFASPTTHIGRQGDQKVLELYVHGQRGLLTFPTSGLTAEADLKFEGEVKVERVAPPVPPPVRTRAPPPKHSFWSSFTHLFTRRPHHPR